MAGQIRITSEEMRGRAKEYSTESQKYQDIIVEMKSLLERLQMEWECDSSIAFADRFEGLKPSFNETKRLMDEIAVQLMATADIIDKVDMHLTSEIKK